jgi:hypothetical protein
LVGKSLEHAQIEVIEEHEKSELRKHKIQFLQLKEAELMETQRMQEYKNRRTEESERRSLQQRTAKAQRVWAEKKLISRQKSKDFLNLFKRDTLKIMVDQGILRAPTTFSFDSHFVPQLHNQVLFDLKNNKEHQETTDAILNQALRSQSKAHKEAMFREYKRREDKKRDELRRIKELEE